MSRFCNMGSWKASAAPCISKVWRALDGADAGAAAISAGSGAGARLLLRDKEPRRELGAATASSSSTGSEVSIPWPMASDSGIPAGVMGLNRRRRGVVVLGKSMRTMVDGAMCCAERAVNVFVTAASGKVIHA